MKDEHCKIKGEVEGYHFLGDEVICPENSIHEICQKATWMECKEDVRLTHGVRPEFVERFYNAVVDVLPHQVSVHMDALTEGNDTY